MRYVIGRMWVRAGARAEFLERVGGYVASSRADRGCVYFHITPMTDEPDGLVIIECWETDADHKAHQASDYAKAFQPVAGQYLVRGDFQEMNVDNAEQVRFG